MPPSRCPESGDAIADLLAQSALGDEPAFARLYDDMAARVYGLVLRVVRNPALAERVTREVFLQVWRNAHSYDNSRGSAAAWLMTSAHRQAVDSVRSGGSGESGESAFDDQGARGGVAVASSERVEVSTEALRMRTVLSRLDPGQREVVELAYFGGYTHSELAALVGAPTGVGPALIRDGLLRLRVLLDEVA